MKVTQKIIGFIVTYVLLLPFTLSGFLLGFIYRAFMIGFQETKEFF